MSITFPTIITVSDYRNFQQGNNSPLRDEDISSAINTTFVQLDGICNSQISIRWGIIDENDPDFLNATKKGNIQKAFLLQTKYNLDYDNDTSEGTTQSNWGSNSTSITRPKRDKISQDVLNYLTLAGVYVQFTTIKGSKPDVYYPISPKYDPRFDNWATKEWANQSFIPKQSSFQPHEPYLLYYGDNKQAQSKKFVDFFPNGPRNSFLFLTALGKLKWIPIEDIGYDGYWGLIGGDIEDQVDLMNYFAKYYVKYQQGITDPTNSTYSAQEIDDKISESAAVFRGTYIGGATRPASFDYDTYCKNQMTAGGITPTNNDYLFIHWTELEVFDRCKYTQSTNTWSYEYTINQIAQKQADWDQIDSNEVDYIKNKPSVVTTNTEQTITSNKTFKSTVKIGTGDPLSNYSELRSGAYWSYSEFGIFSLPGDNHLMWKPTGSSTTYTYTLPTKSGTVAMLSDIPTIPTEKHLYRHTIVFSAITGASRDTITYYWYNNNNSQITISSLQDLPNTLEVNDLSLSTDGTTVPMYFKFTNSINLTTKKYTSYTIDFANPSNKTITNVGNYEYTIDGITDTVTQIF